MHFMVASLSCVVGNIEATQIIQIYPDGMLFRDYADPYTYGRTTDDLRLFFGGND